MAFNPRSKFMKVKKCKFCQDNKLVIDYRNYNLLRKFITDRAKIVSRKITGTCSYHQRRLTVAIKRSREIGFLPFVTD